MTRKTIIALVIIILLITGFILIYFALKPPLYERFPNDFKKRGERIENAMRDFAPKTGSDSLFENQMLILQKSDEWRYNYTQGKPNLLELLGGIVAILLSLGGVVKIIYDVTQNEGKKKHAEIIDRLDENTKQHNEFKERLKVVDDAEVRKNITTALKHIAEKHIYFKKGWLTEEITVLINGQSERLISLSEEIMTEHFTAETYALVEAKIEERNRQARTQITDLFGDKFLPSYNIGQKKAVDKFKANLLELATSNIINSKYNRYRAYSEIFLHDLIENSIMEYDKFKKAGTVKT